MKCRFVWKFGKWYGTNYPINYDNHRFTRLGIKSVFGNHIIRNHYNIFERFIHKNKGINYRRWGNFVKTNHIAGVRYADRTLGRKYMNRINVVKEKYGVDANAYEEITTLITKSFNL